MGKKLEWLALIAPWTAPQETPVEQLQRLTPLLRAIRAKVVVIVEDVDRAGEKFDVSSIFALLAQFREVPGLSFILSISPHQVVDFAKLCESTEILPKPSVEQITEVFQRVRELMINRYPGDELLDKLEDLRSYEDSQSLIAAMAPSAGYWPSAVIELLRVPRILKRVVRRVIQAWEQLHGEMSIDVLFMTAALRESAPAAYSFFELNADRIENAGASRPLYLRSDDHDREVLRQELKTEWEEILSGKSFNKRAVEVLLVNLFPPASFLTSVQTFPSERTQGPSGDRGSIYRRRLFTEHLPPSEPKDQEVLSLIRKDESGLKELAVRIVADESFARLFEYLGRGLKQDTLRTLLSHIHDELRKRFGNRADLQAAEGVFAPWRLAERFGNDEGRQQWVISELKKCVPGYLRLLHSIYYFWLGADRHSLEERQPVREAVLMTTKTVFEDLSIEKFCSSFDPTFPYTLFHLVFTSDYQHPETVPLGTPAEWRWLGPLVFQALKICPDVMVPQFLVAANALEVRAREQIRYEFHQQLIDSWFGEEKSRLFDLIAGSAVQLDQLDPNAQAYVRAGQLEAKKRIERR